MKELKKEKKYSIVDSYPEDNTIVKLEVKAENYIREINDKGLMYLELKPQFLRKAREIFDLYDKELSKMGK